MKTNWTTKKVSECLERFPKKTGVPRKEYLEGGTFPVVDQGQDFIGGFTNNASLACTDQLPVIVFGDHTRIIKFVDFPFAIGADGTKILKPKGFLDAKFFYFALKSLNVETRGYARHFRILKEKEIPLPPLETQKKIVAKIEELMDKINQAKQLRTQAQQDASHLLPAALHQIFEEGKRKEWKYKEIGEVCDLNPKKSELGDQNSNFSVSFIPMTAVNEHSQKIEFYQERLFEDVKKGYTYFKEGDVLFSKITPCMENGKIAIANNLKNNVGFGSTEFHVIRPKETVLPKWLYQIIRRKSFRDEAKKFMTGSAGQKRIPKEYLERIKIPIPSIQEQKEIVKYLDSLSEKTRQIQDLQSQTATELNDLERSILHKAFKGELI